jgi:aerobic-type carbon monoxide dehydrogenase small subunit (CoxS/CutS family)
MAKGRSIMQRGISLTVNGHSRTVTTDPERPLLDVLREDLALYGTKYGCGEGECGACTVLVDGEPVRSCITAVGEVVSAKIETIEGLADEDQLHPVQQAFLDDQAMQCGYCVPGQILTAVALLRANGQPSREEITDAMNGNICRCCNYANIRAAVERAAELQ